MLSLRYLLTVTTSAESFKIIAKLYVFTRLGLFYFLIQKSYLNVCYCSPLLFVSFLYTIYFYIILFILQINFVILCYFYVNLLGLKNYTLQNILFILCFTKLTIKVTELLLNVLILQEMMYNRRNKIMLGVDFTFKCWLSIFHDYFVIFSSFQVSALKLPVTRMCV